MACPENMFFLIGLFMSGVLAFFGERGLIATMPDRLDVLTGSCVQIPCAFEIPNQKDYTFNSTILTFGVWIKESPQFAQSPNNVIFNSSKTDNRYQGNITGNMSQKNCTTVFFNVTTSYSDKYLFRIDSQPYRATDPDKSVNIDVRDLPPSPIITVSGEVKEETPVSLNCSAVAPCPEHPPELTWTLPTQFTPENQLQENPDQTKSVLSIVNFTPSYLHHEKNITCTAVYPVGTINKTAEHTMMLNVSFSPKDTSASISPAGPVLVGSCVNLTCSSTANPPVTNFTWFNISGGKPTQNSPVGTVCVNQTTAGEKPEEPAEDQPEEIHYGDIDFSKLRPKETPAAAQDRNRVQGQETQSKTGLRAQTIKTNDP
ncbi:sialic acid-binding Ig-like lectin 13 [Coregonus clupeaformis]|uniref:sialic acid-binding Ig-like lectin 13 n=1 Tax=Coregonus clupeaformis TaxID=59861 RepID=UPI001BDFC3AC|nr:sialic acid-binding Ig-like lectin 13 [Coregonus clupeaformis]